MDVAAPLAVGLASAAALAYGTADFAGGYGARSLDSESVVVSSQIVGLALVVGWVLAFPSTPDPGVIGVGAGVGVASCGSLTLLFRALARAPNALVAPLCAVCGGLVGLGVAAARGEHVPNARVVGGVVALTAVLLPIVGQRSSVRRELMPALGLAALAGVASGFALVLLGIAPKNSLPWVLLVERLVTVALLTLLLGLRRRRRPTLAVGRPTLAVGIGYVLASWCFNAASQTGGLALAAMSVSTYPLVTAGWAASVRDEPVSVLQWLALLLAVAGLAMMAI